MRDSDNVNILSPKHHNVTTAQLISEQLSDIAGYHKLTPRKVLHWRQSSKKYHNTTRGRKTNSVFEADVWSRLILCITQNSPTSVANNSALQKSLTTVLFNVCYNYAIIYLAATTT
jgi:hypothetical protein